MALDQFPSRFLFPGWAVFGVTKKARASSSSKDEQKEAGAADPKIGKFDISDMDGS